MRYQPDWSKSSDFIRPWYGFFISGRGNNIAYVEYDKLDWNPASDQQALARIWRDGQKRECKQTERHSSL